MAPPTGNKKNLPKILFVSVNFLKFRHHVVLVWEGNDDTFREKYQQSAIGISPKLANFLNSNCIDESRYHASASPTQVLVQIYEPESIPPISRLTISLYNIADWQLLSLNSSILEHEFLKQIKAVTFDFPIMCITIGNDGTEVKFKLVDPNEKKSNSAIYKLQLGTEIEVIMEERETGHRYQLQGQQQQQQNIKVRVLFSSFARCSMVGFIPNIPAFRGWALLSPSMDQSPDRKIPLFINPISFYCTERNADTVLYISNCLDRVFGNYEICNLSINEPFGTTFPLTKEDFTTCVRDVPALFYIKKHTHAHYHAEITSTQAHSLPTIEQLLPEEIIFTLDLVDFFSVGIDLQHCVSYRLRYLGSQPRGQQPWYMVSKSLFLELFSEHSELSPDIKESPSLVKMRLFKVILDHVGQKNFISILVQGASGCGKSTLLSMLRCEIQQQKYPVYYLTIDCVDLIVNGGYELCWKVIKETFLKGSTMSPSVITIDNIDAFFYQGSDHASQPSMHYASKDFFDVFLRLENIITICTCTTPIQPEFYSVECKFEKPSQEEILQLFLQATKLPVSLSVLISKILATRITTYLNLSKLVQFVNDDEYLGRHFVDSDDKRKIATKDPLTVDNRRESLTKFENDINTHSQMAILTKILHFHNGGGEPTLEDEKYYTPILAEIDKIICLPLRYPAFYRNLPLRVPSGVLLYGFPGCGKTYYATRLKDKLTHVQFIYIKGPEILGKYVGESEKAIREIFRRAKENTPAIVFFDEIDSLVPRRGANSEVTDRVVNQFLTELDGVEGYVEGVFVVAASSHPEMIDPALLRPGRIDRHIFCGLPGELEREKLIGPLLSYLPEAVTQIVARTRGYTHADLVAYISDVGLLCDAGIDEHLSKLPGSSLKQKELVAFVRGFSKFRGGTSPHPIFNEDASQSVVGEDTLLDSILDDTFLEKEEDPTVAIFDLSRLTLSGQYQIFH